MPTLQETQLRLIYSLIKPAVRAAARFHVPLRTLSELLRLAYFELLRRDGLSQAEIARRLGQTERHMRSFEQRLREDFFAAEHEVGLVRQVENYVATMSPPREEVLEHFETWGAEEVAGAIDLLLQEERIVAADGGRLKTSHRYVLLGSGQFHYRIDALNHFLDGVYGAVIQRLVHDDKEEAMIKTISFSAIPRELREFVSRLEGDLRRGIAQLEESAAFNGEENRRFELGLTLSRSTPDTSSPAADKGNHRVRRRQR